MKFFIYKVDNFEFCSDEPFSEAWEAAKLKAAELNLPIYRVVIDIRKEVYRYGCFIPSVDLEDGNNAQEPKIPVTDVKPVVRGEWITGSDNPRTYGRIRAICGRCGAFALYEMVNVGSFKEQLSNYCPNCGAKMKGEQDK